MAERELIKKPLRFELGETEELAKYLEEMALEGLQLFEMDDSLYFEKTEPQKLRYAVLLIDRKVYTDENPPTEYIEDGLKKGWNFVDCHEHRVVFMTQSEDLAPLAIEEAQNHKIVQRFYLKNAFKLVVRYIPVFGIIFFRRLDGYEAFVLSEYAGIVLFFSLFTLLIWVIVSILGLSIWYIRSKIQLKKGLVVKYTTFKKILNMYKIKIVLSVFGAVFSFTGLISIFSGTFSIVDFVFLTGAFVLSIFLFVFYYTELRQIEGKINKISLYSACVLFVIVFVSGLISLNRIESETEKNAVYPITLERLGETAEVMRERECEKNETFLASLEEYKDISFRKTEMIANTFENKTNEISIQYSIFRSEFEGAVDLYVHGLTHTMYFDYINTDASAWGANEMYVDNNFSYYHIIVFDNVVFKYESELELDENDIAYIKEAIGIS